MGEEIISLLRLQVIPNVGEISARKLIQHCGSAQGVFKEKKRVLHRIDGIGAITTQYLQDSRFLQLAQDEYRFIRDYNLQAIPFGDEKYPRHLKHCPDAPLLLFGRGNMDLAAKRMISIVGTRNMTRQGEDFCRSFMEELASLDPVIVSGFAYGVDICIQKTATALGLQTIGCLAHGLNQIYPRVHERYCEAVERNGGFITEFWSTSKPERINFLRRNRIIAGMSEATVVIESGFKGGSLVTAELANSYNRDVFAVPGRPGDLYSEGTNSLIKTHKAQLLTSAADLVYYLNWDIEERTPTSVQKRLFVEMDTSEQTIYSHLQQRGKQMLDDIAMNCGMPVGKTASVLLSMEMKGLVRPLPAKYFDIV